MTEPPKGVSAVGARTRCERRPGPERPRRDRRRPDTARSPGREDRLSLSACGSPGTRSPAGARSERCHRGPGAGGEASRVPGQDRPRGTVDGGRMCSVAVAEGLPAAALVLVSYPLHPPGRPEQAPGRALRSDRGALPFRLGDARSVRHPARARGSDRFYWRSGDPCLCRRWRPQPCAGVTRRSRALSPTGCWHLRP